MPLLRGTQAPSIAVGESGKATRGIWADVWRGEEEALYAANLTQGYDEDERGGGVRCTLFK